MLVKFDHLTLVVNRVNAKKAIEEFENLGYKLTLVNDNAVNIPSKMQFLKYKDATHGLYFMDVPDGKGLPVEIIAYEHTTSNKPWVYYKPLENSITTLTNDIVTCKQLFVALGCDIEDGVLLFNGALDPASYTINIKHDSIVANNLDNEGFCCPTIFVKPGNKTKTKIENEGFACTEPELFETNGKSMFVFFAQGKNGEIIEIVTNKL